MLPWGVELLCFVGITSTQCPMCILEEMNSIQLSNGRLIVTNYSYFRMNWISIESAYQYYTYYIVIEYILTVGSINKV